LSHSYVSAELRQLVYHRAHGCCEYCKIPDSHTFSPHEIDHIIAEKHGGLTTADNLALSCILCNKYKGSDIASIDPLTGIVVPLFHPRLEQWVEHFAYQAGELLGLTPKGRVTVYLLRLNRAERVAERRILVQAGFIIGKPNG
jgi:hypothetical protein